MAVFGGIILVIIIAFLIWVALMKKFKKIGEKVTNKIKKTFGEEKGESKQ